VSKSDYLEIKPGLSEAMKRLERFVGMEERSPEPKEPAAHGRAGNEPGMRVRIISRYDRRFFPNSGGLV
jgi:hypothetical protein